MLHGAWGPACVRVCVCVCFNWLVLSRTLTHSPSAQRTTCKQQAACKQHSFLVNTIFLSCYTIFVFVAFL